MKKINKLPHGAYGGVSGSNYVPYVTNKTGISESSAIIVLIGVFLAFIFCASNAYTALISGFTVAAGIPGAILGAGIMGVVAKGKNNILSVNILQGMAAGGESVASGLIYVLPAVFLIAGGTASFSFIEGVLVGVAGVVLGMGVSSIVYNYLIIEEHGTLVYPEAMAISETILTSSEGGDGIKYMGIGFVFSAIITMISYQVFNAVNNTVSYVGNKFSWQFQLEANPLLIGIGFIVGMEVAVSMFAGAVLAYFVIAPIIGYFASMADASAVVWNDPTMAVNAIDAATIKGSYLKYIGAGMMLGGGIIGAIKLIPTIITSLKTTFSNLKSTGGESSSSSFTLLLIGIGIILIFLASFVVSTNISMAIISALLAIIFVFIFSIVSGRMTGDIGTSNLPVSGMTIAALLIMTLVFLTMGWTSTEDNAALLLLGTIVVCGISVSGGYQQTLKTTYIIGGTRSTMQKNYVYAAIMGVITAVTVVMILKPQIQDGTMTASQANLMASLTEGVLTGNLPWDLIFVGVFGAITLFLLRLPIMTIALGFYLPFATSSAVLCGAIVRALVVKMSKTELDKEKKVDRGIIFSTGLVAGGAIVGLLAAVLGILGISLQMEQQMFSSNFVAWITLVIIMSVLFIVANNIKEKNE